MEIHWPRRKGAVALLLLALLVAPAVQASIALGDAHACCPERAPAADASMPCQYVAPLGCCSQFGLPATPSADAPQALPLAFALAFALPPLPEPPVLAPSLVRDAHGPPQTSLLRTTILRL